MAYTSSQIVQAVPTGVGVLQQVYSQTGAVATGTTTIPLDDTIPQNTEGDQYLSLAITPKISTSKLVIDVVAFCSYSVAGYIIASLFQDSTANALAAVAQYQATGTGAIVLKFTHQMTSGTTSATTFKVRMGSSTAGTLTFNGASSGRYFGGVAASSITITEYVV